MKNKVLFFSIDRLGDYLIRSNVIHSISKYHITSDIICSEKNYKLINKQLFFDNVFLFNTSKKKLNKIKFIINFFFKRYDTLISFDGKNISNILLFLIRADFKYIFIYKKNGLLNNLKTKLYCSLLNFLGIRYEVLYSRNLIELNNKEHYPSKYKSLKKHFSNIDNQTYYLENFELDKSIKIKENFILIHLDEKFIDVKDVEVNFTESLNLLALNTNKRIIITAYKNNNDYYKNLKIKKIPFNNLEDINNYNEKIFILEDIPIVEFYNLIKKSELNISCHGGFFVHASLYNKKKTIDVINLAEKKWLNAWITKDEFYKIVYKSDLNKKFNINEIITKLDYEIKQI